MTIKMLITTNKRKRQTYIAWCRLRLFAKRYQQAYKRHDNNKQMNLKKGSLSLTD